MAGISVEQFMLRQPSYPEVKTTDKYYYDIACKLVGEYERHHLFRGWPESVVCRAALCLIGYYQDVIADAGVWHAFIDEHQRLYGKRLPFYPVGEDYLEYELNPEDVNFIVWYAFSMNYENRRDVSPLDEELMRGARIWYEVLESHYEEAPIPEGFHERDLELSCPEDSKALYDLGNWLFMHCYLMTPAYAMTLTEIMAGVDVNADDAMTEIQKRLEQSMYEDPTGPLALYLPEWLSLVVDGKELPLRKNPDAADDARPHKYYEPFVKATGGETVKFFNSYDEMNRFFIDVLGWEKDEEHLPQLKEEHDFVLMVNREKGMLVARNVARSLKTPLNPYYDAEYAKRHSFELLTERGACPGDLLQRACREGWLPDAKFPESGDYSLVAENQDFIARCYLQQYYRGD